MRPITSRQMETNSPLLKEKQDLSDYQLVERIRAGDVDCYEMIMRRYNQRLYRIARSIVLDDGRAMDVVQEAHLKAYLNLSKYQGDSGFASWLAVITRNEALIMLRKLRGDKSVSAEQQDLEFRTGVDVNELRDRPDKELENNQLRSRLNDHIDELPADFRTVFVMRAVEQFSVRETAEILDINQATVKTRFFRAKKLLQQSLSTQYRASVYEVGGVHCDNIVRYVLTSIHDLSYGET